MTTQIQTAWVKPPHEITGLDHLGVQAPCIQIYSSLLPGITNVTDRARYYSFYTWLLVKFEENGWRTPDEISHYVRRADCLLTLIALRHGRVLGGAQEIHRAAMVGNDVLGRALDTLDVSVSLRLSDYCQMEQSEKRYFGHKYGGLGQYYFGAIKSLKLLDGDSIELVRVPRETGGNLAAVVDHHVAGESFMKAIQEDLVDLDLLDRLASFCSCQLKVALGEVQALRAIMGQGWTSLHETGVASVEDNVATHERSKSLAYLCLLADSAHQQSRSFKVNDFRGMSYSLHDHTASAIDSPDALENTCRHWQTYQRNELLSIAMQGLFHAVLRAVELSDRTFRATQEISNWFWEAGQGRQVLEENNQASCEALMKHYANSLPALGQWLEQQHEIQCMFRIQSTTNRAGIGTGDVSAIVKDALMILAALLVRPENQVGYNEFRFHEKFLHYYPVNLKSLSSQWTKQLCALPPEEGLSKLVQRNCLDAHLKVAMRKLRQQGQNTFRFEPRDQGIVIRGIPGAAYTSPRFNQSIRILTDTGLLQEGNGTVRLVESGREFVSRVIS